GLANERATDPRQLRTGGGRPPGPSTARGTPRRSRPTEKRGEATDPPTCPPRPGGLMNRHTLTLPTAGLTVVLALALARPHAGPPAAAGDPTKKPEPTAGQDAVKARTRALLDALGKGDARELAAFWTPTGEYHREELTVRGRANLEKAYAE